MFKVLAEYGKVGYGMAEENIHVNDVGTIFRLTLLDTASEPLDVSGATVTFIFLSPGGRRFEKTASYVTDGTDGKVQYVSTSGDIDEVGRWQYQAKVTVGSNHWASEIIIFKVKKNL